jgi:hypothetical protein
MTIDILPHMAHKILGALSNVGGGLVVAGCVLTPFFGLSAWVMEWHGAARVLWAIAIAGAGMFALAVVAAWAKAKGKTKPGG